MFQRVYLQRLIERILEPRKFLQVVAGSPRETSGMKAFKEQFKPAKMLLVGKSGIPWQELLTIPPKELF